MMYNPIYTNISSTIPSSSDISSANMIQSQSQNFNYSPVSRFSNPSMNRNFAPAPESYHLAHYKGHLSGHDNSLHADSITPAQHMYPSTYSSPNQTMYNLQTIATPSVQSMNSRFIGLQPIPYPKMAVPAPMSQEMYHSAQYRGNQQGHDLYLRADSMTPAQQQVNYGASFVPRGY